MARSLGATLGQGWRFGRPVPLPAGAAARQAPRRPLVLGPAGQRPVSRSPYAAARLWAPQRGAKSLLVAVSKLLERRPELHGLAVVLAASSKPGSSPPPPPSATPGWQTRRVRRRPRCRHASATGAGGARRGPARRRPGARQVGHRRGGPALRRRAARPRPGNSRPDAGRTLVYVLTYDRELVLEVPDRPLLLLLVDRHGDWRQRRHPRSSAGRHSAPRPACHLFRPARSTRGTPSAGVRRVLVASNNCSGLHSVGLAGVLRGRIPTAASH